MTAAPEALTPFTVVNRYGAEFDVAFVLDDQRTYSVRAPRAPREIPTDEMIAVRYVDDGGAIPVPLCAVFAAKSRGIAVLLDTLARAGARYALKDERPRPPPRGGEEGGGREVSGIVWPLTARALARMAAGDYLGYRFRGAAGCVRAIRPPDYATVDFWVEVNGAPFPVGGGD